MSSFKIRGEGVIPYLLRRGHLTAEELVTKGATVHDASRRNVNFVLEPRRGDGFLLKQATGPGSTHTVPWEARIYRAFRAFPAWHPLRRHTVPLLDFDENEGVLLLRCIPHASSLAAYQNQGRFPLRPAMRIGRTLAALHSLNPDCPPLSDLSGDLPRHIPHPLSFHRPDLTFYCNASHANLQAVRCMQSFPDFGALLDALAGEWRPERLIHFDVRGENILLCRETGARSVWLIDWELAALGDPAWDVGSMFADYLRVWLTSIPMTAEDPPAHHLSLARFPLTRIRPALRAFWESYRSARGLAGQAGTAFLLSATRYSAARLVQWVHEQLADAVDSAVTNICELQVSWNILREPEKACTQLLGLDLIPREAS